MSVKKEGLQQYLSKKKKISLYYRIGGMDYLTVVVQKFFQSLLKDSEINYFFLQHVADIAKHHQLFTHFVASQIGGPQLFEGRAIKYAHQHLNITTNHFQKVAGHFVQACKEAKLSNQQINELVQIIAPLSAIICKNQNNPVLPKQSTSN